MPEERREVDPPRGECLICGQDRPFGVWNPSFATVGVCIECRDKARGWT